MRIPPSASRRSSPNSRRSLPPSPPPLPSATSSTAASSPQVWKCLPCLRSWLAQPILEMLFSCVWQPRLLPRCPPPYLRYFGAFHRLQPPWLPHFHQTLSRLRDLSLLTSQRPSYSYHL